MACWTLKEKICHCFPSINGFDSIIRHWILFPCVSSPFWEKVESHSDTAISHSMVLPAPTSSHVDCIRIGQPRARLEGRGYLSYLWMETRAEEKYLKWGVRLFTLPMENNPPILSGCFFFFLMAAPLKALPFNWKESSLPHVNWNTQSLPKTTAPRMTQASYILHFIYLHHITPTNDRKIYSRETK